MRKLFAMTETHPHYLVITMGSVGDVLPFMRVASGLQALGREVTFITHSYHAKLVDGSGLRFIGLGTVDEYLRMIADPDLWHPRKGFAALMATYRDLLEQINDAIRSVPSQAPKVVVAHPFVVPGAAISRECGSIESIVAAYLAPSNLRTLHDPLTLGPMTVARWVPMNVRRALWRFGEKAWVDPVAVAQINAARKPLGLPQVDSLLTHIAGSADLSVTLFPAWFAAPVPDWPRPMISGDFPLREAQTDAVFDDNLSAFLAAGSRPLVFTPGTGNIHAADFFACALAAILRIGRRAIFLTGERAQVPFDLPESILWQPYVPLSALLPHAAVLIHHGGIGTTSEALRAGTPQLVTPFAWDQFDNGARVAALGAGRVTPVNRLRPRTLAASLETLATSAAIHARCAQLAAHFDPRPDPAALCTEIDRCVRKAMSHGVVG
jgi:rhamnosyltransferase subunit B